MNEFYEELFAHWKLKKTPIPILIDLEAVANDEEGLDLSGVFEIKCEADDGEFDNSYAIMDPYYETKVDSGELEFHQSRGKGVSEETASGSTDSQGSGESEVKPHDQQPEPERVTPTPKAVKEVFTPTPKPAPSPTSSPTSVSEGMSNDEIERKIALLK